MALTLAIENETRLPDGGPTSIQITGQFGIDIGRDQHLDWTLPDPDRFISNKHCEIRYRDGAYWLHDVSSNGTFVNGSERRLNEPHRLRNGDRVEIGRYIVAVTLDGDEPAAPSVPGFEAPRPLGANEIWGVPGDAAPPVARDELRRDASSAHPADFLDWAAELPRVHSQETGIPAGPPPEQRAAEALIPTSSPAGAYDPFWGADPPDHASAEEWVSPQAGNRPAQRLGNADPVAAPPLPEPPRPRLGRDQPPSDAGPPAPDAAASSRPPAPAPRQDAEFIRRLAQGAGLPEEFFAARNPADLAEEMGVLMRLVVENLKQLLSARAESRGLVGASNLTMIQAFNNNPLKFSPTPEDVLRIIFGPRTNSYLDARQSLKQSFEEVKAHQINTFVAMQQAVRMLVEELDPAVIEAAVEADRGLGAVMGSRKAKLWDAYVARWEAKADRHEHGMLDAFMLYFSECYRRNASKFP